MTKNIKACIFDLDGVLVDTAKYHYLAWRELANSMGFDFTEKQNERLKGVSRMASLEILLSIGKVEKSDAEKLQLAATKNSRYVSLIEKMTPDEVLPGVISFLDELKAKGIRIALGSASKNAPMILERTNIGHYFEAISDGNIISKAKPDPEVFLTAATLLGVEPQACLVFEDAEAGVEAAIAGGMSVVGVGDKLILHRADIIIENFVGQSVDFVLALLYDKY